MSQGILKALDFSSLKCRVLAACINSKALGLYTSDLAFISPVAESPDFIPWLVALCKKERVDAILSGTEPVLDVLTLNNEKIFSYTSATCIVSTLESSAIGGDKLTTCKWLRAQGLPYPDFADAENALDVSNLIQRKNFPLIAKPRKGKGAAGIFILRKTSDLEKLDYLSNYVVQELLGDENNEYTVACFTDKDEKLRGAIVFHRFLQNGTTISATAGAFPDVRKHAIKIVERLRPRGPCNVQMRLRDGVPVCFEINVRFSGTTPVRARLGFNDVEAAIKHYVLRKPAENLPIITKGQALRYWNEAYINPEAFDQVSKDSRITDPKRHPLIIENYGQHT